MEYKDYYQLLGVARDASQDDIKKAYRRLARKYHPDVSKEADAEARFQSVQEAYEVLKDPEKRAAYDQLGSQWQAGQEFRPPPGWKSQFHFDGNLDEVVDLGDLFETLFGGMPGAGPGGRRTRGQAYSAHSPFSGRAGDSGFRAGNFGGGFGAQAPSQGEDQHVKLEITLEESYQGSSRRINLQIPEVGSDGQLHTRSKTLNVKIPPGTIEGQQIRLAGQGGTGYQGRPGDLYLDVVLRPHRLYRVDERDVILELPITPWEAALGQAVKIPTLGGQVELKIPPGSQSGAKLRLKGRGLPGNAGQPAGDQYVVLKLVTPAATTESAREFYQRMARELPMDPRAELGA
ncbi:MAG: DnaJ domain-containing protein [Candidatus Competibacteraceae bacterium]|nr:DnaJ domain-containing protein [Candidatus Competibacteraceae bacterium]